MSAASLTRWTRALRKVLGPWLGTHEQYARRPLQIPPDYFTTRPPPNPPCISLVTPSLNQGRFLERTLRSVLDQAYPNLEYVVQDGGSRDESPDILQRHASRLFRCESAPDQGQAQAINLGFRGTTGAIMAYLNSDDLLLPGALAFVAAFFEKHPEVEVIYGHRIVIDEEDFEIGRWVMPPHSDGALVWTNYIPQETLFWRRRMWERTGGAMNEDYHYAFDWELLQRFQKGGARFARVPRFLGAFRCHARQKSTARLDDLGAPEMNALRDLFHHRPVSTWERRLRVLPYLCRHWVYQRLYHVGWWRC